MLRALYEYAEREQLVLPPGFVNKTIKAYILLTEDARLIGIALGDDTPVLCPDIGSLANGKDKSNVLVEKRSIVMPQEPNSKSSFYYAALADAAQQEPLLGCCVAALDRTEIRKEIVAELDRLKIKAQDRLSFQVQGKAIVTLPSVRAWWETYRQQFLPNKNREAQSPCLITGLPTTPMATVPPVSGLDVVGGHSRGDALICFDKTAFCSYGLKKSANAPVSEEAFSQVKAALDHLLSRSPILAGMKFVHWYDRDIPQVQDPVFNLTDITLPEEDDEDIDEVDTHDGSGAQDKGYRNQAAADATRLVGTIESGEQAFPLPSLYYILLLSGVNGRVMVRRFEKGSYQELEKNITKWNEDLSMTNRSGTGLVKPYKLTARLIQLLKRQKTDKRPFDRMNKELAGITPAVLQAILSGGPLPDAVAARSLAYIRSQMFDTESDTLQVPDDRACQWLKVWLIRKEIPMKPVYDPENESPAYQCGALMAVYAALQQTAYPDVNVSVVQRYYAAAIQSPALTIGQLDRLSNHHLAHLSSEGTRYYYGELLAKTAAAIQPEIPVTLDLIGQSSFALGYRHMSAELIRQRKQKAAEKAAKQDEKPIQQTRKINY